MNNLTHNNNIILNKLIVNIHSNKHLIDMMITKTLIPQITLKFKVYKIEEYSNII